MYLSADLEFPGTSPMNRLRLPQVAATLRAGDRMDRFRLGKVAPFLRAMDGEKAIVSTDAKTNGLPPHFERSQSESSALDRILCSLRFLRWVVSCFTAPAARQTSPSPRYRILRPYRFPAVFGLPLNELFFASLAHAGTLGTSGLHGAGDRSAPRQARPPQSFREFRMQQELRSFHRVQ